MHFKSSEIENFQLLYQSVKLKINSYDGCEGVTLVQDTMNPEIFFTLSHWQSTQHLDHYRTSALFEDTWAKTKVMFAAKPMAWSTQEA